MYRNFSHGQVKRYFANCEYDMIIGPYQNLGRACHLFLQKRYIQYPSRLLRILKIGAVVRGADHLFNTSPFHNYTSIGHNIMISSWNQGRLFLQPPKCFALLIACNKAWREKAYSWKVLSIRWVGLHWLSPAECRSFENISAMIFSALGAFNFSVYKSNFIRLVSSAAQDRGQIFPVRTKYTM